MSTEQDHPRSRQDGPDPQDGSDPQDDTASPPPEDGGDEAGSASGRTTLAKAGARSGSVGSPATSGLVEPGTASTGQDPASDVVDGSAEHDDPDDDDAPRHARARI